MRDPAIRVTTQVWLWRANTPADALGQPDDPAPPVPWLLYLSVTAAYEEQVARPGSAKAGPGPPPLETQPPPKRNRPRIAVGGPEGGVRTPPRQGAAIHPFE